MKKMCRRFIKRPLGDYGYTGIINPANFSPPKKTCIDALFWYKKYTTNFDEIIYVGGGG